MLEENNTHQRRACGMRLHMVAITKRLRRDDVVTEFDCYNGLQTG